MKRGEIWVGNLNPNRGSEIGKVRPVLILQDDWITSQGVRTIVVLPLTSKISRDQVALRPILKARGRLQRDSQVVTEQPRSLSRNRIGEGPLATASADEMAAVEKSFLAVLGIFR
jgi:mRNA interferase MazF